MILIWDPTLLTLVVTVRILYIFDNSEYIYSMSHLLLNPAFFNNSNTKKDIATKFEQEYVRCVRNEEECVCSVCL